MLGRVTDRVSPDTGTLFVPVGVNRCLILQVIPCVSSLLLFHQPALRRSKQVLLMPSVYHTVQCAGDTNYQQMTVAVPNVDQMVKQGSCVYGHRGGRGVVEEEKKKTKRKAKEGERSDKTVGEHVPHVSV